MTPPPSDDDLLREMELHALRRRRRYWLWMSLLPGLVLGPLTAVAALTERWREDYSGLLVLVAVGWVGFCLARVIPQQRHWSPSQKTAAWIGLFALLMMLNAALFTGLFFGTCGLVA